jgi:hypothetical protein
MPAIDPTPDAAFTELEQTATLLASGFEALLSEVENLVHREQDLKRRLDFAHDEVCGLVLQRQLLNA